MEDYLNHNFKDLIKVANLYSDQYKKASPFPNIYFDDFFNPDMLKTILGEFPDLSKKNSISFKNQNEVKLAGKGEFFFGFETKKFMNFLNSEPFLNFLQVLTGIEETLIGDPYYVGGGQHEIKRGGFLKIHADFNKHNKLKLDRRINVLIYLNENWLEEYGGHFELWNSSMTECVERILPKFNTMAIFSTTDYSYHGHPDPLNCPENISRKSLALYYYTNGRPKEDINKGLEEHSTLFKGRIGVNDDVKVNTVKKKTSIKSLIKDFIPPIVIKTIKLISRN